MISYEGRRNINIYSYSTTAVQQLRIGRSIYIHTNTYNEEAATEGTSKFKSQSAPATSVVVWSFAISSITSICLFIRFVFVCIFFVLLLLFVVVWYLPLILTQWQVGLHTACCCSWAGLLLAALLAAVSISFCAVAVCERESHPSSWVGMIWHRCLPPLRAGASSGRPWRTGRTPSTSLTSAALRGWSSKCGLHRRNIPMPTPSSPSRYVSYDMMCIISYLFYIYRVLLC